MRGTWERDEKVLDFIFPAQHKTPYFWTSTLWPAAELDYGEWGGYKSGLGIGGSRAMNATGFGH